MMNARQFKNELVALRRDIHRHPELGDREFRTTRLLQRKLRALGIRTKRVTPTGVIGVLQGGAPGRCVALRGDIDALPVTEQTGRPWASRVRGVMHACGHDGNTACVYGAAVLLAARRDMLKGSVKFIFQPNEESAGGARGLIRAGALRAPKVGAIFGIHMDSATPFLKLGVKYGDMMAAVDRFRLEIHGGGGHAAYPHLGKDTLLCAAEVVQSLQQVVTKKIAPVTPAVISVCAIRGGHAFNVFADRVAMEGTVRLFDKKVHAGIDTLIRRCVAPTVARHGLKFDLFYERLNGPLANDNAMADLAAASARKVAGVHLVKDPSMGGEDFEEYLRRVPGCFLYIGSGGRYPFHHPQFDIDERVLPVGAAVLAQIAEDYLAR